jgi:hypothetical protein
MRTQGHTLGNQSCARQSTLFRQYESNQVNALLGQTNLAWNINMKQGVYNGHKVFDHQAMIRDVVSENAKEVALNRKHEHQVLPLRQESRTEWIFDKTPPDYNPYKNIQEYRANNNSYVHVQLQHSQQDSLNELIKAQRENRGKRIEYTQTRDVTLEKMGSPKSRRSPERCKTPLDPAYSAPHFLGILRVSPLPRHRRSPSHNLLEDRFSQWALVNTRKRYT